MTGPAQEVLATLLVRAFGAARRWSPSRWDLPPSLRTARALDAGRALVLAARHHAGRQGQPPAGARPRAADADQVITLAWGCDLGDLEPQAWDRGIPDLATLRRIAAPFTAYARSAEIISDMTAAMSVV
jgi:hypothetical protein